MKILLSLGTLRSDSLFSVLLVSNTLVLVIVSSGVERSNLEGTSQLDLLLLLVQLIASLFELVFEHHKSPIG